MRIPNCVKLAVAVAAGVAGCVPSPSELAINKSNPQGQAVMAHKAALEDLLGVELRSATALDGINTNVLRIDLKSRDKTLAQRTVTSQKVAAYLRDHQALPKDHPRVVFDFPVSFTLGCAPISLYERVQLETQRWTPVQQLAAQRVMANDGVIPGSVGEVILDDAQWNVPFFLNVDRVELAQEVMGVPAGDQDLFVSVHALWTNIGMVTATMGDDPWHLWDATAKGDGGWLALLEGGNTHLARNGGAVKMAPVGPGKTAERWYVFKLSKERLAQGALVFGRQRFAKHALADKQWQKAGLEMRVLIKDAAAPGAWPTAGNPVVFSQAQWQAPNAPR